MVVIREEIEMHLIYFFPVPRIVILMVVYIVKWWAGLFNIESIILPAWVFIAVFYLLVFGAGYGIFKLTWWLFERR